MSIREIFITCSYYMAFVTAGLLIAAVIQRIWFVVRRFLSRPPGGSSSGGGLAGNGGTRIGPRD